MCACVCLSLSFSALTVVVQAEAMELVPTLNNPEMTSKDEEVLAGTGKSNNKLLTGILFEFCHSILLQFSVEELSQVRTLPLLASISFLFSSLLFTLPIFIKEVVISCRIGEILLVFIYLYEVTDTH